VTVEKQKINNCLTIANAQQEYAQNKNARLKDLYFKDKKCYLRNSDSVMCGSANYKCINVYCNKAQCNSKYSHRFAI